LTAICASSTRSFYVRLLRQPDKVTLVYQHDDDFRQERLNQPHPATVIPSVHRDLEINPLAAMKLS
jgi:hypothetical protein